MNFISPLRHHVFQPLLCCLLCLFACVVNARADEAAKATATTENILENGDFETLNDELKPSDWRYETALSAQFIEDENSNHYVSINAEGSDEARRLARRYVIKPEWKSLKITARVRAENLQIGDKPWRDGHIVVTFYDEKDAVLAFTKPITLTADTDWKTLSGTEAIPPSAHHSEIEVANFAQSGTFSVDDVTIEPDGAIDAPLLRPNFPEGHFEIINDGEFQNWPVEGLNDIRIVEENGNHFLRLTHLEIGGYTGLKTSWRLKAGTKTVKVSARMRVRGLKKGEEGWQTARLGLSFTNAQGLLAGPWPLSLELQSDSDWKTLETTLWVPPDAVFLRFIPEFLDARGVFDVDDIEVEQLP